jgi:N-acetylmuramoyl-L-alanine amidase
MKICIDAGHGGSDPGAVGSDPYLLEEKEFNLNLARELEAVLESRGHWVVMTRRKDRFVSLPSRANFANRLNADFFVSIHANAAESPLAEGMEVFYFPGSEAGRQAADYVLDSMLQRFADHRNRGVKSANFTVLRLTDMAAILVESEFLTHPDQLQFLANPQNRQILAEAISDGIEAFASEFV